MKKVDYGVLTPIITAIAYIILCNRKLTKGDCSDPNCPACLNYLMKRIAPFVLNGKPVQTVFAAFPYKVAWPVKTISAIPDMAERKAFEHLEDQVGRKVAEIYSPGIEINIGSDGYPFFHVDCRYQDGFSVEAVHTYLHGNNRILREICATSVKIVSLDDFYSGNDYDWKRKQMLCDFSAHTLEEIGLMTEAGGPLNELYSQMKRHMEGDLLASSRMQAMLASKHMSKNELRREAANATRETIFLSEAYRNLLSHYFPDAIRLSIHPIPLHDTLNGGKEKIGVEFGDNREFWFANLADTVNISPWYSVAVVCDETGQFCYMKRSEAKRIGAESVCDRNGVPTHYVMKTNYRPDLIR